MILKDLVVIWLKTFSYSVQWRLSASTRGVIRLLQGWCRSLLFYRSRSLIIRDSLSGCVAQYKHTGDTFVLLSEANTTGWWYTASSRFILHWSRCGLFSSKHCSTGAISLRLILEVVLFNKNDLPPLCYFHCDRCETRQSNVWHPVAQCPYQTKCSLMCLFYATRNAHKSAFVKNFSIAFAVVLERTCCRIYYWACWWFSKVDIFANFSVDNFVKLSSQKSYFQIL